MNNYLIEGLSGTGKSSVCRELRKRGYCAIDSDEDFAYFCDPETGLPTEEVNQFYLTWDKEKVDKALRHTIEPTFVCGGLVNLGDFAWYFKKTFILQIDDKTLRSRILTRTGNDFGKKPEELERQLEWNKGVEEYARQKEATLIDATLPLEKVVDKILEQVIHSDD